MEPIQIASAVVAFAASAVPFYFLLKIKSKKQMILSSFLAATLIVFGIHSIVETMEILDDNILQICFVVSLSCLIVTYYVFKTKKPYSFNGAFGVVMILVFGIWAATEILENYVPSKESLDALNSAVMIVFGIFVIARFLWSRKTILYETSRVKLDKH